MKRQWIIVAAALMVTSQALAQGTGGQATTTETGPLSVLLQKGIYQEETVGDLAAAARTYRQVIEQGSDNRQYVAQALYRLGVVCLKQKQAKEAKDAFVRLKVEYAEQKDLVAKAEKSLAEARALLGENAADLGPVVIRTQPATLTDNVDPALDKITVTFDRKMMDESWSWTGGGETFPKIAGKISYDPTFTTCTLPVTLEPGHVYRIGINSPSHRNFRSAEGQPAPWSQIVFATRSADGKPTPIPADLLERAEGINAAAAKGAPVVLKTNPVAMANKVPATLTKINVTFDQAMMNNSWSWTGGGETYPKITGKISYDEARTTCTLPVALEPGKVYWVGINSPSHRNFQSPANVPTRWYVILFATAGADGKPTPIPENLRKKAAAINAASRK